VGDIRGTRRAALRRRYLSLGVGELLAAAVFALVAARTVAPRLTVREDRALWSALVPLLVVLVQAATYWLSARRWVGRAAMPAGLAALFRVFKVGDVLLLAGGLGGVLLWLPERPGAAVVVAVVWLFALLEYLNYYVVRLSYPLAGWFSGVVRRQTPRLVQDLAEEDAA
jgi:hypothetical protein